MNNKGKVIKECGGTSGYAGTSKKRGSGAAKSYIAFGMPSEQPREVELNGAPCYDFFFLQAKKEAEAARRPWVFNETITKRLTVSDCDSLSRLLIPRQDAKTHIFEHLDSEMKAKVESPEGLLIDMLDWDDGVLAKVIFKMWGSSEEYVLNFGWRKHFVQSGKYGVGDQIGLRWEADRERLLVKLLTRPDDQPAKPRIK